MLVSFAVTTCDVNYWLLGHEAGQKSTIYPQMLISPDVKLYALPYPHPRIGTSHGDIREFLDFRFDHIDPLLNCNFSLRTLTLWNLSCTPVGYRLVCRAVPGVRG